DRRAGAVEGGAGRRRGAVGRVVDAGARRGIGECDRLSRAVSPRRRAEGGHRARGKIDHVRTAGDRAAGGAVCHCDGFDGDRGANGDRTTVGRRGRRGGRAVGRVIEAGPGGGGEELNRLGTGIAAWRWSEGGRGRTRGDQSVNGDLLRRGCDVDPAVGYERWHEFRKITKRVRRIHVRIPQLRCDIARIEG